MVIFSIFLLSFVIIKCNFILESKTYSIEDIFQLETLQKTDIIEIFNKYSNSLNIFQNYFVQILKLSKEINHDNYFYLENTNSNATKVFIQESCYNIMKVNYSSEYYYLFIIDEIQGENDDINYMNKFSYIIFNSEGDKLNVSKLFCDKNTFYSENYVNYTKTTIDLNFVLEWKREKNIDLLNIKDDFFWNVCIQYKDDDGYEMTMNVRKKKFYQNYQLCNNTVDNSVYSGFEYNSENDILIVKCSYRIFYEKGKSQNLFELDEDLVELVQHSNFKVLACYKIILNFKGKNFISNIGNLICFLLTLGYIAFIILYIKNGTKELEIKLNYIYSKGGIDISTMNINYKKDSKTDVIYLKDDKRGSEDISISKKYKFKIIKIYNIKKNNNDNKTNKNINFTQVIENKNNNNENNKNIIIKVNKNNKNIISLIKNNENDINEKSNDIINSKINEDKNNSDIIKKHKYSNNNIDNNNNNDNDSLKYLTGIIEDDLNELEFEEANVFDKRKFWEIYLCFFSKSQLLCFSFYRKDFNIRIIKYVFFMFQVTLIFLFDTMFYTDTTMENYYESKYVFDFIGTFRRSIISTICTSTLLAILKCLCYSEKQSYEIRFCRGIKESFIRYKKFLVRLKIRIIIFFIFVFILHLGCYYFIKGFCAIYQRSQFHLLLDVIISIILNNIYPGVICFIPTLLRFISLKKKCKVIYCFSQIF